MFNYFDHNDLFSAIFMFKNYIQFQEMFQMIADTTNI